MQEQTRAAGYIRVSTDEQAKKGLSLEDQDRRVIELIAERGWENLGVFPDAGVSGSVPFAERPGGAQVLAAEPDVIIVVAWDRLSRDAADFLATVRDHEVVSIVEQGEPPLVRDLRAVLAQEEKRTIRRRAKDAARALAREGRYNGPRLCGYRLEDTLLVVVEHEKLIVVRVFREFIGGYSLAKIARGLNADGVRTARGGLWRSGTIRGILTNPVYIGTVRDPANDGETFKGQHEGIVDPALWEKAQALITANAQTHSRGRGRPTKGSHIFRDGLLECGECGSAMVPRAGGDYFCGGRLSFGPDYCSVGSVRRHEVDAAVLRYFESVGLDLEATLDAVAAGAEHKLAELRALRKQAEAEAQRAVERLARVRRDYADGELPVSDWKEFKAELTAERDAAEAEVGRLRAAEAELESNQDLDAEAETLRHLAKLRAAVASEIQNAEGIEGVRAALKLLFEKFILYRGTPGRTHVELIGKTWIEPVLRDEVAPLRPRNRVALGETNTPSPRPRR
jgi:DNA invertase Pin-like site-specific DNA recombinase